MYVVFWLVFTKLRSYKAFFEITPHPQIHNTFHHWFSLHIFVNLMKKKPSKFNGVFDHFSQIYEVTKFQMIKLCLDVSDVIHANEHT